MQYSGEDVQAFVREEDVRFIHLSFCDVFGRQKNIAILPTELERAFTYGIAIDASAILAHRGVVFLGNPLERHAKEIVVGFPSDDVPVSVAFQPG